MRRSQHLYRRGAQTSAPPSDSSGGGALQAPSESSRGKSDIFVVVFVLILASLACTLHIGTISLQDLVYDLLSDTKMIALHISIKLIYCPCVNDISISISARDAFL